MSSYAEAAEAFFELARMARRILGEEDPPPQNSRWDGSMDDLFDNFGQIFQENR